MFLIRLFIALVFLIMSFFSLSNAQVISNGDAVATCFSFSQSGYVAGIIKVQDADQQTPYQNWAAPMYHGPNGNKWTKANLGDVFGIAIDNGGNIYLSATQVYSGNNTAGPGGFGAIYRIDAITGLISNFVVTDPNACNNVVGTNTIPNTGSSLGNIAFDAQNNQLFATNFEDGKIYRIDLNTGNVLSTFDPFNPDGCIAGHVPLDERLWGIGIFNNRVYFSRWRENCDNQNSAVGNEIWSVGLTGSGDFTGTEQLEINIPALQGTNYSNPVADIAFSTTGKMLLAERTMRDIANNPFFPNAHASRVIEYELSGGNWSLTPSIFSVGLAGLASSCGSYSYVGANAAGGVDYAYGSFDKDKNAPVDCDSTIWATGDGLRFQSNNYIYGMQNFHHTGGVDTSSVMIDLDGNIANGAKTQIGDVEIYKRCIVEDNPEPCDNIITKYEIIDDPDRKRCCVELNITNNQQNYFTSVQANVLTNGVSITSSYAPQGWGTTNNGQTANWNPTSGTVPTGNIDSLDFCIFTTAPAPQQVEIVYYAADGTDCRDTIRLDCKQQEPPQPDCFDIREVGVECVETGPNGNVYEYSVIITNNSPFSQAPYNLPAANVLVYSNTTGVNVQPNTMSFTPIGFGQNTGVLTFTVSGPNATAGTTVCLDFQLHGESYGNDYQWCCPPQEICFRLTECKDCCDDTRIEMESDIRPNNSGVSINSNFNVNPNPIIKANATIVSVHRKEFGFWCKDTDWFAEGATVSNPANTFAGLPLIGYPQPFASTPPAPFAYAEWGINPGGVTGNGNMNFDIDLPPAPFRCRDSVRICINYSFTDTNCVTCDTLVCYDIVRVGRKIILPSDDVVQEPIFKMEFDSYTNGRILIGSMDYEENINFSNLKIMPRAGISIESFEYSDGRIIEPKDGGIYDDLFDLDSDDDGLDDGSELASVTISNENEINEIVFDVSMEITTSDGGIDKSTPILYKLSAFTSTEGISDTEVVLEDIEAELPPNVNTYILYIVDNNKIDEFNRKGIASVRFTPESDDVEILALGSGTERGHAEGVIHRDIAARNILLNVNYTDGNPYSLGAGEEVRPVYITLSSQTDDDIILDYQTFTEDGNVINESQIVLEQPATTVEGGLVENKSIGVSGVYPNPANSNITINYYCDRTMRDASMTIYNSSGRKVAEVFNGKTLKAGNYISDYSVMKLPTGSYFITIESGEFRSSIKFNIVR